MGSDVYGPQQAHMFGEMNQRVLWKNPREPAIFMYKTTENLSDFS